MINTGRVVDDDISALMQLVIKITSAQAMQQRAVIEKIKAKKNERFAHTMQRVGVAAEESASMLREKATQHALNAAEFKAESTRLSVPPVICDKDSYIVHGYVLKEGGYTISGQKVRLTTEGGGAKWDVTTNEDGYYSLEIKSIDAPGNTVNKSGGRGARERINKQKDAIKSGGKAILQIYDQEQGKYVRKGEVLLNEKGSHYFAELIV